MKKTEKKNNNTVEAKETKSPQNSKKKFCFKDWFKDNKIIAIGVLLIAIAFLGGYYLKSSIIAATVNGRIIFRSKVTKQLESYQGAAVLDSLVIQELIKQEARSQKLDATDEEVAEKIKPIEDSILAQGTTLDQLLAEQGMTRKDLEENYRMNVLVEKLLASRVTVTDEEVQTYIDQNKDAFPEDSDMEQNKVLVKQQLLQEKMNSEYQVLVQELRDKAKVNIVAKY